MLLLPLWVRALYSVQLCCITVRWCCGDSDSASEARELYYTSSMTWNSRLRGQMLALILVTREGRKAWSRHISTLGSKYACCLSDSRCLPALSGDDTASDVVVS
ncbi:hypothetical protein BV20DRAFT_725964 [Pilatotrama ljubarskyi]|nr:hypothetical protein BV20DRAFT_725964 [Pilatotrama ljubarskyi]